MEVTESATVITGTESRIQRARTGLGIYLELAKARLGALVVLTTLVGFVLSARGHAPFSLLLLTLLGTTLSAFGANILNQWWEIDRDRKMQRTQKRPLPSGRVTRPTALRWGLTSTAVGLAVLQLGVNTLTASLAFAVVLLYVLVYTPMKVRTPLNTLVGAVCGAIPPMMGWTAVSGRLETGAWILFAILFVWQIPHFLALAWMYRDDYARGGFRMLPAADPSGRATGLATTVWAFALLPISAMVSLAGISGNAFLIGSQILGLGFTALGIAMLAQRNRVAARRVFLASILYLPLMLGLMVADMDDRVVGGAFVGHEPQPQTEIVERAAVSSEATAGM